MGGARGATGYAVATATLAAAVALGAPDRASAQDTDFLFGEPKTSVQLRGGYLFASAQSDVFGFFSELLTVEGSDFNAPTFGLDIAHALNSRVDLFFGLDFSRASVTSEYRDFVEDNDLPITQRTELASVPVTMGVKLYVAPRGRSISRYAYIPAAVRPYVGAGGGFHYYRLTQFGDFVDFVDLSIFSAELRSSGVGPAVHAFAGVDVRLTPKWYLAIEGRYLWAKAGLEGDFVGFESIDMSGLRTQVGFSYSF